jgi:hypothetical protein
MLLSNRVLLEETNFAYFWLFNSHTKSSVKRPLPLIPPDSSVLWQPGAVWMQASTFGPASPLLSIPYLWFFRLAKLTVLRASTGRIGNVPCCLNSSLLACSIRKILRGLGRRPKMDQTYFQRCPGS